MLQNNLASKITWRSTIPHLPSTFKINRQPCQDDSFVWEALDQTTPHVGAVPNLFLSLEHKDIKISVGGSYNLEDLLSRGHPCD